MEEAQTESSASLRVTLGSAHGHYGTHPQPHRRRRAASAARSFELSCADRSPGRPASLRANREGGRRAGVSGRCESERRRHKRGRATNQQRRRWAHPRPAAATPPRRGGSQQVGDAAAAGRRRLQRRMLTAAATRPRWPEPLNTGGRQRRRPVGARSIRKAKARAEPAARVAASAGGGRGGGGGGGGGRRRQS